MQFETVLRFRVLEIVPERKQHSADERLLTLSAQQREGHEEDSREFIASCRLGIW